MGIVLLAVLLQWKFNTDVPGQLPVGWQTRGDSPRQVYRIETEANGNRYLAADSQKSDVQLGTTVAIKPKDRLTLAWRWRVRELPPKASERTTKTMDSAASVYVVFGSRFFPHILKYVWSTTEPVGAAFKHPRSDRMAIVVVESGGQSLGLWQIVTRDIVADYKTVFGSFPDNLTAIGLKTDSDSTGSSARADYDDVRLEE